MGKAMKISSIILAILIIISSIWFISKLDHIKTHTLDESTNQNIVNNNLITEDAPKDKSGFLTAFIEITNNLTDLFAETTSVNDTQGQSEPITTTDDNTQQIETPYNENSQVIDTDMDTTTNVLEADATPPNDTTTPADNNTSPDTDSPQSNVPSDTNLSQAHVVLVNILNKYGNFIHPNREQKSQDLVSYDSNNLSWANHEQTFTATAQYGNVYFDVSAVYGHVYYLCAYVKATSTTAGIEFMDLPYFPTAMHSGSGEYEFLSVTYKKILEDDNLLLAAVDISDGNWQPITVKLMHAFDLTTIYGPGNEPSKTDMDILVKNIIETNGYFSIY